MDLVYGQNLHSVQTGTNKKCDDIFIPTYLIGKAPEIFFEVSHQSYFRAFADLVNALGLLDTGIVYSEARGRI